MKIAIATLAILFGLVSFDDAQTALPATTPPVAFTSCPIGPAPVERIDPAYQWSLQLPNPVTDRRAYLWIPPQCKHVKGVAVGLQNMAEIDDATNTLRLLPIPPRTKFPIKVTVGAFQWGRGIDPKIASAEPVIRAFEIQP